MHKSDFQFTKPVLSGINFQINSDYIPSAAQAKQVDMDIHINVNVEEDTHEANIARVEVTVNIGTKDSNTPFYLEATESAKFKWNPEAFDKERVNALLNQNAAALLLSYLRPIISNVTASSPYDRFDLPFINLT